MPVGVGHGNHPVGLLADLALVAAQLVPLHQRVGRGVPAGWLEPVGLPGSLLQHVFCVVVVEHQARPADGDGRQVFLLPGVAPQRMLHQPQPVRRHLDTLDLHHIVAVALQQHAELSLEGLGRQPQPHVGRRGDEGLPCPVEQRTGFGSDHRLDYGTIVGQWRVVRRIITAVLEAEQMDLVVPSQVRQQVVVANGSSLVRRIGNLWREKEQTASHAAPPAASNVRW